MKSKIQYTKVPKQRTSVNNILLFAFGSGSNLIMTKQAAPIETTPSESIGKGIQQHSNVQEPPPSTKKTKKNKKRKRVTAAIPKPGEEGYLTPTQLRNARKRRNKKTCTAASTAATEKDPSSIYLANPKAAPICQTAKTYFHSLGLSHFGLHVGPTRGWRTVSKLAVRGDLSIGLFAPHSHRIVTVPDCTAHHPSINAAVETVERCCRKVGVKAFDETTGQGGVRYVAMNVERSTGKIQLTIVWNSEVYPEDSSIGDGIGSDDGTLTNGKVLLDQLLKLLSPSSVRVRRRGTNKSLTEQPSPRKTEFHSLWVHFNSTWKHSNAIFSIDAGPESWKHVFGPNDITEQLSLPGQPKPIPLHFPPNVFRQANLDAFTNIIAKIRSKLTLYNEAKGSKASCVELYGGVGTIGLNIADLVSSLTSSDENPFNKACFEKSAGDAGLNNVTYDAKNATDMVQGGSFSEATIVVVDPPRKGFEEPVLTALCTTSQAAMLVYVSCGFDAFQRDCAALLESGKWKLEFAEGHLLFPGSDAIETLAFFISKDAPKA